MLLVAPYKHYSHYWNEQDKTVVEGVLFITSDGTRIVNYPKQHSENMTAKHQASKDKLKPIVRLYKNIRNKLVERKIIRSGAAPSYLIEGMLSNVPPGQFAGTYQQSAEAVWGWINTCDHGSLMCANGIHQLSADNTATSWPVQDYIDFVQGVPKLWVHW